MDVEKRVPGSCIVIAGGPGSGKSTLLNALRASGERCYEEVSRVLIREQLAANQRLLPWDDLLGFAHECSRRMQSQLADSARFSRSFVDRGLPDLIGYLSCAGVESPAAWRSASNAYARTVFFAPAWRDIYVNDSERPQSFREAQELGARIRFAYEACGFRLVELVKDCLAARLQQVLDEVSIPKDRCRHG